jgi:hypothetical protein
VRLDPFNWILIGRLGFELELGLPFLPRWMTIETVPMFIMSDTPPLLDYSSYDVDIAQHSGGLGPLAGATLGVNFWLEGKPLKGYFVGTGITNYTVEYESKEADGVQHDLVSHTERQLYFLFGSLSRFGPFTIGGGIGFGYDLNNEVHCLDGTSDCDAIQLAVPDPSLPPFEVTPFIYPWDILARFSLGVTID